MHITHLIPRMHFGGAETVVAELATAAVTAGHQATIISQPGDLIPPLTAAGVRHIPFDCAAKNPLTALPRARRLRRLLAAAPPHIVHLHSRVPAWLYRLANAPPPAVTTFHGFYRVGAYSAVMTRAQAIICPSTAVQTHISDHYGTPASRLHLIPNGIDLAHYHPAAADQTRIRQLRDQWRLHHRTTYLIAGRITLLKGHPLFLRAFARLLAHHRAANPATPLPAAIIAGDDDSPRSRQTKRLAQELGIADHIRFIGIQRQMREIYALADATVSATTQKPETFGKTTAESLAMQRPAAAPAHGGALDLIKNHQNGILYPPGDEQALAAAMQTLPKIPPTPAIRQTITHLALPLIAQKTHALYHAVKNANAPPPSRLK